MIGAGQLVTAAGSVRQNRVVLFDEAVGAAAFSCSS